MTTPPNGHPTNQQQKEGINGAYLMKLCAGGIVKLFANEMEPEKLSAIAAAASAYAALEQNVEIQDMKEQLEQLQNDMKLLALGQPTRNA